MKNFKLLLLTSWVLQRFLEEPLMSKLTKDEQETLEWICLVGSLKIKELEETADSEKMVLLHKHKENIMKLLTKNWNE